MLWTIVKTDTKRFDPKQGTIGEYSMHQSQIPVGWVKSMTWDRVQAEEWLNTWLTDQFAAKKITRQEFGLYDISGRVLSIQQ